jgi:kelch-like protein 10
MGGFDGSVALNTAERYDYQTNQWSMIAPMNEKRCSAGGAVLNGKIYITGGYNDRVLNSAEVYDPEVNQWTLIREMTFARSFACCIAYHGYVHTIGGFKPAGFSTTSSGEKYDPTTNTWTQIPDMFKGRSRFGIGVIDKMFVMGGFDGETVIPDIEYYDE